MEERYTELFQNVYGAKNEHPLNKIEEKQEEIKDIVKEALGMLNQARDMTFGIDETEIQDDITNALNIFLATEEKQQELPPGENLFTACTDEELFMFYDAFETKTGFEYLPKLNRIRSQYASFRRCYMDFYKDEKNKQTLAQVRHPLRKAIRRKQKYMHRFISNEDIERFKNLIIAEEHKNCKDYINYKKSYEYLFYFGFTKIRDKCKDTLKIIARMKKELEEINDLKEDRKGS